MSTKILTPAKLSTTSSGQGRSEKRQDTTLTVLAGLILGTAGAFVIEANQDPITTVAFRCAFGCMALFCFGAFYRRLPEIKLKGHALLGTIATGILVTTSWALHFAALSRTSISVATVVFHIQPFLTMAIGAWVLHEKISKKHIGIAVLALVGLAISTGFFDRNGNLLTLSGEYVTGILMSLISSLVYAFVPVLAKMLKSVTSFALAWWQCFVGAILTIWWPIIFGWPTHNSLAWLIGLGILSALAYALMFVGYSRLSTSRITALQFVYPLTAVVVDWQVYGHTLSAVQIGGLILMALAIWSVKREI